jgi:esterase/lipase
MPFKMRSVLIAFTLCLGGLFAVATAGSSPAAAPAAAPSAVASEAIPVTETTIVYLANVGSRYHNKDCKYLKKAPKSAKSITILDAMKKGFAPCNQCKAPKLKRG